MSELLRVEDLSFAFDENTVLDRVRFSIQKNSCTLLCGINGSGKTTLLNLLSGVLDPTCNRHSIYWKDQKITLSNLKDRVSYLQSPPPLFSGLTGKENVELCKLLFEETTEYQNNSIEFSQNLGLDPKALSQDIAKYSQGMLQKLWLGLSLSRDKELYLLDEPFNGLDHFSVNVLTEYIIKSEKTYLIVAHEPPSILSACSARIDIKVYS